MFTSLAISLKFLGRGEMATGGEGEADSITKGMQNWFVDV